jgi:Family of unknown function (DUF5906)
MIATESPMATYVGHRRLTNDRDATPPEKINHALVLGGKQGIGKDSMLEPVKHAVGSWNFAEVSPQNVLGNFNGFLKSVILRISEARDLGEVDRFKFYDHSKAMTAAPPDVLRVNEKNLREHYVPNVTGVIITTNHKTDSIFLPADDRRHFVAWSELDREDFRRPAGTRCGAGICPAASTMWRRICAFWTCPCSTRTRRRR